MDQNRATLEAEQQTASIVLEGGPAEGGDHEEAERDSGEGGRSQPQLHNSAAASRCSDHSRDQFNQDLWRRDPGNSISKDPRMLSIYSQC